MNRRFDQSCLMILLVLFSVNFGFTANEPKEIAFVGQLVCHDLIQVSLDENCEATIRPQHLLEQAGPNFLYEVIARDWITNAIVDNDPIAPFVQIGEAQIGKCYKITIREISSGNSCWGKVCVEDKLPPIMTCPRDTAVECFASTEPISTGEMTAFEACGFYFPSYYDVVIKGSCALGYDRIIKRYWIAVDESNNRDTCIQTITVRLGDFSTLSYPLHYDGLNLPGHTHALSCDAKIDKTLNVASHILPWTACVDGFLLDSAIWVGSGQTIRVPRTLGWNCIDVGNYIGHPSPYSIYYPANYQCWDANQYVMWEGTGHPGNNGCATIASTFRDIRIDISKPGCDAGPVGCYKILRVWTLLNWCTGQVLDTNQIIKVMDNVPPQVLYPDSLAVSTDPWRCEGRWDVAPAWIVDNCSEEIHYTIRVDNGTVLGNDVSGYVVVNLPLGIQNAYIVAEDCCGNITEKRVVLNVIDDTPPNAVCDQKTVVTITGNQKDNTAKVFAETFDDGSFDNCSPHLWFKVICMDDLLGTNSGSIKDNHACCDGVNGDDDLSPGFDGNQVYYDDFVKFCCADVGKTVRVVMRVFDRDPGTGPVRPRFMEPGGFLYGHYSDCMVEVEVQDKSIPTVVAPPDVVVSCEYDFDITKLTNPADSTFGKIVNDVAWRGVVRTNDIVCNNYCVKNNITGYPGFQVGFPPHLQPASNKACEYYQTLFDATNPLRKYNLNWGFDGYVLASCAVTPVITIRDLRVCGQGRILRDITATGPNGIIVLATQTIWIVDCDPFYINRQNHCDPTDDIIWPACAGTVTHINGCGADISPDNPLLGRPVVVPGAKDHCNLIAIEHFDEIFTIEPDACYKILRKWVVIDWCQYNPNLNGDYGRWEFTQVIKVRDTIKPIVICNVGPCEPAVFNPQSGLCSGHINLTVTSSDSCTPSDLLITEYKIDLFNNGTFDLNVGTLTLREFNQGFKPPIHNNPYADNSNNPFNASGTYPIGIHRICWYVEDGCGNVGQCCTLFEVKDCKAPTPYCLTGIITVPMPTTGCVDIWAKDLNLNSFDNCTPADKLKFYFDGDTNKTFLRVCCEDFVRNQKSDELTISVQMWVQDQEGNRDYCQTTVIVQDNQNICPNPTSSTGNVNGLIRTEDGLLTAKADVELYQNNTISRQTLTGNSGYYLFGDLPLNNEYVVKSKRNDNATNGVSTADIVKIQRHILGIEELNSPYKLIAADVNNTDAITAADISEIRKLILGINPEFSKTSSWVMIPSDYTFADPKQPFEFNTEKNVVTIKENNKVDFVAVKMGDVNNSAVASNLNGNVTSRNAQSLNLYIEEAVLKSGDSYTMNVKATNFTDISGFQFTLNFDARNLVFEGFEAGALQINESNLGTNRAENGTITMSWDAKQGTSFTANDVLFTFRFGVLAGGSAGKSFGITSDVTAAEAYHSDLTITDIMLSVRADKMQETGIFELYQNVPNPFDKETSISFRLNESAAAKLSIYDVTGKVIYLTKVNAVKGLNTIKVNRDELNGSGMYFYQLDSGEQTATRRMIILE